MAYADPINAATPDGAVDQARQGDDNIREFKRAVQQRLASFFINYDADPMVPKNGSIPGAALVDLAVLTAKIADLAVTTGKLADGAVTAAKLAALAVTTANIIDASVTQAKLANLSVGTAQIIDAAVTAAKLAASAVLPGGIGAGTFGFDGVTSTNGYRVGGAAPANQFLAGDGAWATFRALLVADFPDALLQKLLLHIDGWYLINAPASSSSFMTRFFNALGTDRNSTVMTQAGEVRKVWLRGEAARTAGSLTAKVSKNGADTGATAVIDAANPQTSVASVAAGAVTFVAGDLLAFNWTTVGFAPNNTTHVAGFEARYT
jgi:hypothetical protein